MFQLLRTTFGDPAPATSRDMAIKRLTDPQANQDDISRGLYALAERGTDADIARLIGISNSEKCPDHWHEWIADALFSRPKDSTSALVLLGQLSTETRTILMDMLDGAYPEWQLESRTKGEIGIKLQSGRFGDTGYRSSNK